MIWNDELGSLVSQKDEALDMGSRHSKSPRWLFSNLAILTCCLVSSSRSDSTEPQSPSDLLPMSPSVYAVLRENLSPTTIETAVRSLSFPLLVWGVSEEAKGLCEPEWEHVQVQTHEWSWCCWYCRHWKQTPYFSRTALNSFHQKPPEGKISLSPWSTLSLLPSSAQHSLHFSEEHYIQSIVVSPP